MMRSKLKTIVNFVRCGFPLLLFVAISAATTGWAAPVPPIVKVPKASVSERLETSSQSGGVSVVGLVAADLDRPVPNGTIVLSVGGISAATKKICVRITNVSGLYHVNFNLPNPRLGPVVALEVPIRKMRDAGKSLGEFAVQASSGTGPSCDQTRLPVVWSRQAPTDQQYIAINALDAVSVRILSPDRKVSPCRPMNNPGMNVTASVVAFSHLCKISTGPACEKSTVYNVLSNNSAGSNEPVPVQVMGNCKDKG